MKIVSAAEAVQAIKSNDKVYIHSAAATPERLLDAMVDRHAELKNVNLYHMHIEGKAAFTDPKYRESFKVNALFVSNNVRHAVQSGYAEYIPIFYSEIPRIFRKRVIPLDVALMQVSPPDKHGNCSLGVSVESSYAAMQSATTVIAQINPNMPRTHGDGIVHISKIDFGVEVNDPIVEIIYGEPSELEMQIGRNVASIVEDGATIQMGVGSIPNCVLSCLTGHQKLGVHTEMFSDGLMKLVEKGVITNEFKIKHPGKIVSSLIMGSKKLYDFVDDNQEITMLDIGYVNDTAVIRQNPKVTAINGAIEVDMFGQICADSIGLKQYSGVGGHMDFMRGAMLSDGGKPIVALPSVTNKGESKIVNFLKHGASIVTTRGHARYVVTEYGVADLYARSLKQRAKSLIAIAHPMHRENLLIEATKVLGAL